MATVSPSWNYTLHLPRDPRAPGVARGALRLILAAHEMPELAPTAELMAAELLTNSHLHTKGPYSLRVLSPRPGRLRVAVWDTDPRIPPGFSYGGTPAPPSPPDAEHGRGLHLVRACADEWGVSVLQEPGASRSGKLLWADCGEGNAG
ncbi:ATP-binding protein [Streptomyces sp. NBC_01275]|uniref:ATP-binding protein n=1 Tax=Streptomyces sp. NBC_01275 TaxID=2903807 RepID=UPI0022534684|nr:ATP-binding protein [Streptomyces sp. NBC_01275]MCX4762918.1 ATP-binding protein [Streptomyces sp. NBC_01275]